MKFTPRFAILTPMVLAALLAAGNLGRAAVGLTISPSAVSNTYSGFITLQVSGLANANPVVVQKFLDVNTNALVDAGDLLVQQFNLADGQPGMVIGGVTNLNVPGDTDTTAGQITARLSFRNGDFVQNLVGQFAFVLSSPSADFPPVTNFFAVTNFPFAQQLSGVVASNGVAVSNAVVILFPPPRGGNHGPGTPVGGAVADDAGRYAIQVPPGTYVPLAFRSGYVADYSASPVVTLGSSQTVTTNLALIGATSSISGQIVDAGNSSIGLPGVFLPAANNSGLIAVAFSQSNGDYTVQVGSGVWNLGSDDGGLIVHGYVGYQDGTNVAAGSTGVVGPFYKATAMFYGSVRDSLSNSLPGIDISASDNNNGVFQADGYSDANGRYAVGVVGGLGDGDPWGVQVSTGGDSGNPTNYVYSLPQFDQNGGTNLAAGQALKVNFTALLATNHITGHVQFNGTNLVGVGVFASANIGGVDYNAHADTDVNGNYSLNVGDGNWSVGVDCTGGNGSLDNVLGPGNYLCPNSQNVSINNANGVANFTVQPCGGIEVITSSPLMPGQVGLYYSNQLAAASCSGGINWSLNSGTVPPGLTLYSAGALNGTPTNSGTFNFSVHVTDGGGHATNTSFSLTINPPPAPPTIASPALLAGSQFQMTVNGSASQNYTVQMSTNLASTNWIPLLITNPSGSSFLFQDAGATNPARYYRVLLGP